MFQLSNIVEWWNTLHQLDFNKYFIKIIHTHIDVVSTGDHDCGICSIFSINFFNEI